MLVNKMRFLKLTKKQPKEIENVFCFGEVENVCKPFTFFYATNTKHHHHHCHCHRPHQTISVVATDLMPMASITKDHLAITTITSPHPPKPPLQSLSLLRSITSVSTTSTTVEFTCKSNTFLCESNNTKCSRDHFSCNQTYKKQAILLENVLQ